MGDLAIKNYAYCLSGGGISMNVETLSERRLSNQTIIQDQIRESGIRQVVMLAAFGINC